VFDAVVHYFAFRKRVIVRGAVRSANRANRRRFGVLPIQFSRARILRDWGVRRFGVPVCLFTGGVVTKRGFLRRPGNQTLREDGSMTSGYYQSPTIHGDTIVLCAKTICGRFRQGAVWRDVSRQPGRSHFAVFFTRWTAVGLCGPRGGTVGSLFHAGLRGPARRLTHQAAFPKIAAWTSNGKHIVYSSDAGQPFERMRWLWQVPQMGYARTTRLWRCKRCVVRLRETSGFGPPYLRARHVETLSRRNGRSTLGRP